MKDLWARTGYRRPRKQRSYVGFRLRKPCDCIVKNENRVTISSEQMSENVHGRTAGTTWSVKSSDGGCRYFSGAPYHSYLSVDKTNPVIPSGICCAAVGPGYEFNPLY